MDNATQYEFDMQDVAKLLILKQGITEGHWQLAVGFNLTPTNAGPTPETAKPSIIVTVDRLILAKAEQPGPTTVEASALQKK